MRLATCIALELAVAAGAVGGVWLGVTHSTQLAHRYFSGRVAEAATAPVEVGMPGPGVEPLPAGHLGIAADTVATVFPRADDDLLAPLGATPITRTKLNHGGTSLSLRLDFASGARAAFKPMQTHPQSDPRREIAAYRLDRLLGIGHVAPAKSIALSVDDLVAGVEPEGRTYTAARISGEGLPQGGILRGAASWWIPEIKDLRFEGKPLEEPETMAAWAGLLHPGTAIPKEHAAFVAQLATVILFDVLIDNADRWSGSNTKGSMDGQTLYFMDNTLSFSPYTVGHEANLTPLRRIEVFPRKVVGRIRALTYDTFAASLAGSDPGGLAPLLTPIEIRAVLARRDHVIQYIDALIAQYGEAAVLALP